MKVMICLALVGLCLLSVGIEGRPGGHGRGPGGRGDRRGPPRGPPDGERPQRALCSLVLRSDVEGEEPNEVFSEACTGDEEQCDGGPVASPSGVAEAYFCQRPRPRPLHSYACLVELEGEEPRAEECEVGECTLGPLDLDLPDDMATVSLTFCDQDFDSSALEGVVREACLVQNEAGEVSSRDCRNGTDCNVGPLDITLDGEAAEAFFCEPPPRERDGDRSGRRDRSRSRGRGNRPGGDGEEGDEEGDPAGDGEPAQPLTDDERSPRGDGPRDSSPRGDGPREGPPRGGGRRDGSPRGGGGRPGGPPRGGAGGRRPTL